MVFVGVAWARSKQEGSMQRLTLITVACAAIIGAVAFVGSSGAQQPGPPTGTLELVSLDRETHFKFVDNPPRSGDPGRPSPGDLAIITGRLRDTANRRAGKLYAVFMRVAGKRKRHVDQVRGTFVLRNGHIVVEGVSAGGRTDNVAVIGGTGRYAGARGTLRVTSTRKAARYRFTFIG
jgi:hypothetical protein